jgi:membrane-associated protease RseP (regulator of RpoE activity)
VHFGWAKPVPVNFAVLTRDQMLKVALAGPVSNLLLAVGLAILFHLFHLMAVPLVGIFVLLAISSNLVLALFNLLPIPILDGALVLFSVIEWLRRKRLSLKWQINFQRVGFALILALMAFTFVNDIAREATRQMSLRRNKHAIERPDK